MQQEALPDDLKAFEGDLLSVIREGLALFQTRFGALRAGMTVRTERNNIHDCLVEAAKKRFPKNYRQKGNLFLLALGQYRIKLKKLTPNLMSSSFPTQAVFDFLRQKVGALFDNTLVNLHLGYVPDSIELLNSAVWVTCPTGLRRHAWVYEMRATSAATLPVIPAATQPDAPKKPLVQPKKQALPKAGEK